MRRRHKLVNIICFTFCAFLSLMNLESEVQGGGMRLRRPFSDNYRITAYVDHDDPYYLQDNNVVVYNGEEREYCPTEYSIWTAQGPYCYHGHDGTDYSMNCNTPVLAAACGTVIYRDWEYGETIKIDHGNGYETWYAHLNRYSVNMDDTVVPGQQIGLSGNTGTTACHLHFGVYHNGQVTDPFGWRGGGVDPISGTPAKCLWGAGQCAEIVLEDESAWFTKKYSGWQWFHQGNSWTMRYINNVSSSPYPNSATWRPVLPHQGIYQVYAFIPAVHGTTTNAKYVIHHVNNSNQEVETTVPVNQGIYHDQWVNLGTYRFWNGNYGYVYLNNATGEASGTKEVSFDSVKFVQHRLFLGAMYGG